MAQIPEYIDPTLEAMFKAIEDNYKPGQRDYIGASEIGDPCSRKIWYNYHNYPKRKLGAIGLMAADSGHYAENKTAERLRLIEGIELHTHKPDGTQFGWERHVKLDDGSFGKIAGHYDGLIRGLIQAPKKIHIWEHKDKDQSKFLNFKSIKNKVGEKNTLKEWNIIYYAQAQINMHMASLDGLQIDRHYMTVSYAGGRKYDSCRTEYNPEDAQRLYDKALKILNHPPTPVRLSDKPDFFLCRFCDFREVCHKNA